MQWFERLGVPSTASRDQIKKQFRRLSAKHHPDVNPAGAAAYRLIVEAYTAGLAAARGQAPPSQPSGPRPTVAPGGNLWRQVIVPLRTSIVGGLVEVETPRGQRVNVRIPAGVAQGARLRVSGHGELGDPPGDLILEVVHGDHPSWMRNDPDVLCSARVTWLEAYRGDAVQLETPWGPRWITLPSGTKEGDRMTLAGHGLRIGKRHGDLRVAVRLVPPVPGSRALEDALAAATFQN